MKKYVKKTDVVDCIQWSGLNIEEVHAFCTNREGECRSLIQNEQLSIMHPLVKGYVNNVEVGNYIVKKSNQTFVIYSPDEFSSIYKEFKSQSVPKPKEKIRVESNILKIGLALPIKFSVSESFENKLTILDDMGVQFHFNEDGSYNGYVVTKKGTAR